MRPKRSRRTPAPHPGAPFQRPLRATDRTPPLVPPVVLAYAKRLVHPPFYAVCAGIFQRGGDVLAYLSVTISPGGPPLTERDLAAMVADLKHFQGEPGTCPEMCRNVDLVCCPLCYLATGTGCPHGDPCDACTAADPSAAHRAQEVTRARALWIAAPERDE